MRRPAIALLLLAACATPVPPSPAGAEERGTFTQTRGDEPPVTERFTRRAGRLESELTAPGRERVEIVAELAPDARVTRYEVRQYPRGGGEDRLVLTLDGDSATLDDLKRGERTVERFATRAGVVPMLEDESAAMVEQVLRRARALGGATAQVPILDKSGSTRMVTVTFTAPDRARIEVGGRVLDAATDAAGRLLAAEGEGGLAVRRSDGH